MLLLFSYMPDDVSSDDLYANACQREMRDRLTLGAGFRTGANNFRVGRAACRWLETIEVLALFACLCANISASLWKRDKISQNQGIKKSRVEGYDRSSYYASPSLMPDISNSTSTLALEEGGGVRILAHLAVVAVAG